jgi:hypothetical protein
MATQYVAVKPIFVGRARAANPGDPIPESHPQLKDWLSAKLVKKVSDDAAKAPEKS